jgi:hypothetical protein
MIRWFRDSIARSRGRAPRRPLSVPPCRCGGTCRCSGLVPALLLAQLERECEFYRDVL